MSQSTPEDWRQKTVRLFKVAAAALMRSGYRSHGVSASQSCART